MPIAPAAKGILIVSGVLVAASIALYENEQVREWIQTTSRKISGVWDDVVNFDQRQRERRAQPQEFAMGGNQQLARGNTQERRDVRRSMYEGATEGRKDVVAESAITGVATARDNADANGMRKRIARDTDSHDDLLGDVNGAQETEDRPEILFDQVEDPAVSVPEEESVPEPQHAELPVLQPQAIADQKIEQDVEQPPLSASTTPINNISTSHKPTISLDQQEDDPFSDIHQHPSSQLQTLAAPTLSLDNSVSPTHSSASLSPVLIHESVSSASSDSSGGVHTPQHEDDFENLSDAGTETASHISDWRDARDDDIVSVASEDSGWSEVGGEMERQR